MRPKISEFVDSLKRVDIPRIVPGDKVKCHLRIIEGAKERQTVFAGTVIGLKGYGIDRNITVRKVASGVGVEKIIPLNSPLLNKVEITSHSVVRRAKLNFLKNLSGKKARLKERIKR